MIEQHKLFIRLPNLVARQVAAKWLANREDDDPETINDFSFDGRTRGGIYWAAKAMGENGRLRFPEGHPQAGGLISGHFLILAWQGPLDALPDKLLPYVLTDAQITSVFPNGPPEVMG